MDSKKLYERPISELIGTEYKCDCGRTHKADIKYLSIRPGAIEDVTKALEAVGGKKVMLICDIHGYEAAAKKVCSILDEAGFPYKALIIPEKEGETVQPNEFAVGYCVMQFDRSCDVILAVGSGVINDVCKVLGTNMNRPTIIVGTAPSMDGYASYNSSMEIAGLKYTLSEQCPAAIVCDTEIMAQAPMRLLWAGLGDMFAKDTALFEWKMASFVNNEHYCDEVAGLVRYSLSKIYQGAEGLGNRDELSVRNVTEGLVISGLGMAYMGYSRPASGLEHYFSHCWEMMCLSRGQKLDLHGIQVGIGTLITIRILKRLAGMKPTMQKAIAAADAYDQAAWEANLTRVYPALAQDLIKMEERIGKNAREGRLQRAQRAIEHWDDICALIDKLPEYEDLLALMTRLGMPTKPSDIDFSAEDTVNAFVCSRDVRDKYLTSSLIFDLGLLEDFAQWLGNEYK